MAETVKSKILVTGGAGYIGSHTVVELVNAGYSVVIVDSLINSSEEAVRRIRKLVTRPEAIEFYKAGTWDVVVLARTSCTQLMKPRSRCESRWTLMTATRCTTLLSAISLVP